MRVQKLLIFILIAVIACKKPKPDPRAAFVDSPRLKSILPGILDEASGMADSKINAGYLWVQQDSGNPNDIALISYDGSFLKKINIKMAVNRDWEDMAISNGPVAGTNYIYIADIGDNSLTSATYFIYRFAEPAASSDTVFSAEKITFQYPDGSHDAEAILIDNNTKDIYIITKQDTHSQIYKLAYPQSTNTINTAILSGSFSFNRVTSAAISSGGNEILIRTYDTIRYWKKNAGQSVEQVLTTNPIMQPTQPEPQGEAICFKNDNSGFFTLSERPPAIAFVNLNFYKRK